MVSDTWASRDLPVLKAIVEIFDETGDSSIQVPDVTARVGLDEEAVQRALRALYTEPYLQENGKMEIDSGEFWYVGPPTGEALRVAGAWPSPEGLLDRLVAALERAAEDDTREPQERSKLKQIALSLRGAAYQVALGALGGAGGNIISG
jgi:hypothetical protein